MRFTIKWLLAGTLYAALAAAAWSQAHWSYAALLWVATFFAVTYALTAAICVRGRRQAAAVGFAVASVMLAVCLHFAPESLPIGRLVAAAAPPPATPSAPYFPQPAVTAPRTVSYQVATIAPDGKPVYETRTRVVQVATPGLTATGPAVAPTPILPYAPAFDMEGAMARTRAANAVATMLAGLVGSMLGVVAHRRARSMEGD
jgi:hypothetical protein